MILWIILVIWVPVSYSHPLCCFISPMPIFSELFCIFSIQLEEKGVAHILHALGVNDIVNHLKFTWITTAFTSIYAQLTHLESVFCGV